MIVKIFKTYQLSKKNINQICKLKNTHWNYGVKSQLNFFKKNYNSQDNHICIINKNEIIAYNCLRIRKYITNKNYDYYLFDALIVSKKFRGNNLSSLLMIYNNFIIKKSKLCSILVCNQSLVKFYKKFNWILINRKKIKNKSFFPEKKLMIFNKNAIKNFNKFYSSKEIFFETT